MVYEKIKVLTKTKLETLDNLSERKLIGGF